jgi:hypothetical protein
MKRVRIILVLLFLAIVAVIWWQVSKGQEPVYKGRTVDSWLNDITNNPSGVIPGNRGPDYCEALGHMGPKAVPYIFHKLSKNDSPFINKYRDAWPQLPGFCRFVLPQPHPISFNVDNAVAALSCCGTNATPLVIKKLNDGNPAIREAAWNIVQQRFAESSIPTNEINSLCIPAFKDSDALVRIDAVMSLGRMGAAASNAVPALIPLLSSSDAGRHPSQRVFVRANTALLLGRFGPSASAAVPALTNLMAAGDGYARVSAAVAVWQITSNEIPSLTVIMNELPTFNKYTKQIPINALKEMGPRAKAAFPLVLNELPLAEDTYQREAITNALKAIDPDAAAKAGIK